MAQQKYIVITRPIDEDKKLEQELSKLGFSVFYMPSISIHKNELSSDTKKTIQNLDSFDWVVFTSQNGVRFFIEALEELDINISLLKNKHLAAVGPKTEEKIKKYGLSVYFIPSKFTTSTLAKELPDVKGKRVLLPRANIASPQLITDLKKRGATVVNISMYTTLLEKNPTIEFEKLLSDHTIACITFTSPSTVEGFLKNIDRDNVLSLPTIAIGPVTAASLKKHGLKKIVIANTYTIDGLVTKVKENVL